jgi:hypothetical protein
MIAIINFWQPKEDSIVQPRSFEPDTSDFPRRLDIEYTILAHAAQRRYRC